MRPLRFRSPVFPTGTYCCEILHMSYPTWWITASSFGVTRAMTFVTIGRMLAKREVLTVFCGHGYLVIHQQELSVSRCLLLVSLMNS